MIVIATIVIEVAVVVVEIGENEGIDWW